MSEFRQACCETDSQAPREYKATGAIADGQANGAADRYSFTDLTEFYM